jgi:pimeloyl-ACP methyl ester carboxylesterase
MASRRRRRVGLGAALGTAAFALAGAGGAPTGAATGQVVGRARSADGVEIVYTVAGAGRVALVLIHGGLADRTFWEPQLEGLSDRYRVAALDLAGHGESGGRESYAIASWAADVKAVADALHLKRIVLVGNSLGGPVALEAAHLLAGRVLGVVGVDTLHDLTQKVDPAAAHVRAEAFRTDFTGACRGMVDALFHPGKEPELRAWAEGRMCKPAHRDVAVSMMESFGGYDVAAAARAAGVPVRAINGDLWPTNVEVNRAVVKDFDVTVMKGCGHYPMLERPAEFNRILDETVRGLEGARS